MTYRATETLLQHMQVPGGWSCYYLLGCFERRVTLYTQQVRALNLVWSLFEEKRLAKGNALAVIGGGAAGLAAAAAALHLGAAVTVLERKSTLLSIQRNCRHRWLHPHVYDWPARGSLQRNAGLPLVDWHSGYADAVVRQLDRAWQEQAGADNVVFNVRSIDPHQDGTLTWNASRPDKKKFDAVILAIGFGLEETEDPPTLSYWDNDNLDRSSSKEVERHLVSGCGDGGLVDLLRIRIHDFQHHEIVKRFVTCTDAEALSHSLLDIEKKAKHKEGRGESSSAYLWDAYQSLDAPPEIDASLNLRPDTTAALCTRDGQPYTLRASILNRFLVSRLLRVQNGKVELRQGELSRENVHRGKDGRFSVQFANGEPELFDKLTIRHGPTSALQKHFPAIWKACEPLRARNALDQTRDRLWPKDAFGPEPPAEEDDGPPSSSTPSRRIASTTQASGLSLTEYLKRIEETTGRVTLAGDTEPRHLEGVFVELQITRAGSIPTHSSRRDASEDDARTATPPQDPSWEDIKTELAKRRDAPWAQRRDTETIPADALLDLAHRTLIVGAAGTGKSTLIRWLACKAAKARLADPEARIPVWLDRVPSCRDLDENLGGELARRALKAVGLDDGSSEARRALESAISSGRSVVLIDSLDEAGTEEQTQIAPWLRNLEGRVIFASRPSLAESAWHDVVQVTLHGIPSIAAEQMLHRYFPGEPWVGQLIEALRGLADGRLWLETPVLLGLAATLFRINAVLPASTLDLYRQAIDHLLQSKRLPEPYRGDFFRPMLQAFAKERLLPDTGRPQVSFDAVELPDEHRGTLLKTGLFEGTSRLRFTHLSLGERLAAEADVDLGRARERLAQTEAEDVEGSALEVLPMAHAIQAPAALEGALTDARVSDRVDHRLLQLLLRSIGYGGEGVIQFCRTQGSAVVRLIAERLQSPGGRFSDAERKLMNAAERAFIVLRPFISREEVEGALSRLLRTRGEAAAEAHAATWILGVRPPGRAPARWWATIHRQARAIVRERPDVDLVRSLTSGSDVWDLIMAIKILGKYSEYWPRLRPFLDHSFDSVREVAIAALADDEGAQISLRERLTDDKASIRANIVSLLGASPGRRAAHLDRLRGVLASDPSMGARATAIHALADDPWALPWIRRALEETTPVPKRISWEFAELRNQALQVLANDESSAERIRGLINEPKNSFLWREDVLIHLARVPEWRKTLLRRLMASDVSPVEVSAMADDPDAHPAIVTLLDHERSEVVITAIDALKTITANEQSKLVALLDHEAIEVRCASVKALGQFTEYWPKLHRFLGAEEQAERSAALEALRQDPDVQDKAYDCLHADSEHIVRQSAVKVLAYRTAGRAALREYFTATRVKPADEWIEPSQTVLSHCYLRAFIVRTLAIDSKEPDRALLRSALEDPNPQVREAVLQVLPPDSSLREKYYALTKDEHDSVRHAAYKLIADDPGIRARLVEFLNEDQWAVRISAFHALVSHADAREKLRSLLSSSTASSSERVNILQPLLQDPTSLSQVRDCIRDKDREVQRTALRLLQHDPDVRRVLRDHARDAMWLQRLPLDLSSSGSITEILASDPEAHPILREHLASEDEAVLQVVAPMLTDDVLAGHRLRELLDHPNKGVQREALRALGKDEVVRPRVLAALSSEDNHMRERAAEGLRDVIEVRAHFLPLLRDHEKRIRQIALQVLQTERDPMVKKIFREMLIEEPEDALRVQILEALAGDFDAIELLRNHLHHDSSKAVRIAAARALGTKITSPAVALTSCPSVARMDALLHETSMSTTESAILERLRAFIEKPAQLNLDAEPEFGELALAWVCVRLAWASEDGGLGTGRIFGEVEQSVETISNQGRTLVIRIAMDASELPRERFLHPNHNLIEAWRVAQHLRASNPPSVLIACANVDFEHLSPPALDPGKMLCGPTLFGFRLHDMTSGNSR